MRDCPVCHSVSTLVNDYQEGCVVCSSCCTVIQWGLQEDANTAWDEDNTGIEILDGKENFISSNNAPCKQSTVYMNKAKDILEYIAERANTPTGVITKSLSLISSYSKYVTSMNQTRESCVILSMSCFSIASAQWCIPIPIHEIVAIMSTYSNSQSNTKVSSIMQCRNNVIEHLGLKLEMQQLISRQSKDLCNLYLTRLSLPLARYADVVESLSRNYTSITSDSQPRIITKVLAMIYLSRTSKTVCQQLTKEIPLSPKESKEFLKEICTIGYEKEGAVKELLTKLIKCPEWIISLVHKTKEELDSVNQTENSKGSKRERTSSMDKM